MKKLIQMIIYLSLSAISVSAFAIEYGQYICTTELTNEDPDSFPIGVYQGYLHTPAYDGNPEQRFQYSLNSSDFTEIPLSAEDFADGMLSARYNLFVLDNKNISGEFIYSYNREINRQIYFFEKQSDVEFLLNIISIYDGNQEEANYVCQKRVAYLS